MERGKVDGSTDESVEVVEVRWVHLTHGHLHVRSASFPSLSHLSQTQNRLLFRTTAAGSVSSIDLMASGRGAAAGGGGAGGEDGRFDAATAVDRLQQSRCAPRLRFGQAGTLTRPDVEGGHEDGAPCGRRVAIKEEERQCSAAHLVSRL